MNELIEEFNKKYIEIIEIIDDAIEEGDLLKVKKLVISLQSSVISPGCIYDILKDCMDTAYRGTKVDPPNKECFKMVKFFESLGIKVPNYKFYGKRIN